MKYYFKSTFLISIILVNAFFLAAQSNSCKRGRGLNAGAINAGVLSTGNSGTGANIDVVYQRCNWTANPDDATKTLKGNITTYFKTIATNVSTINFDFNNTSFNNDSLKVFYHGAACNFSFPATGEDVLNINLPVTLVNIGTLDSITINYKGIPPAASGQALGYQRDVDGVSNNYIYTLSESYEDKDWWPCKADMQDKIDSLDINVTVPSAFWVAANGAMIDSSISGANRTFKFKHRYPIASYLVALGIAKFKRIYLGTQTVGSNNVPFVVNYFPDKTAPVEANILNVMTNNKTVFDTFNVLYGNYPFAKEKTGFYQFGYGGGMEHQTFSAVDGGSLQDDATLAHELGHQWWGDKVTFSTWKDLWLAEGFATYSEVLASEFVSSIGMNWVAQLGGIKSIARSNKSTAIYLTDISNSDSVWKNNNISAVYDRGCMVASMLRALMGDAKYFTACKNYLTDTAIAYKAATTADLQRNMQAQFGENMSKFFNEWIYKKGSPKYTLQWGNVAKKINIKLTQTVSSSGTTGTASTFFPMPVVLKIQDTINGLDTTVVIYHKAVDTLMFSGNGIGAVVTGNIISYQLSFTPNKILFDPQNKTMAIGTVSYAVILPITNIDIVAKKSQDKNQITATVITTDDIEKVELQKSIDGNNFYTVGWMQVISSTDKKQYQLVDESIDFAGVYYRVKMYSANQTVFSKIIFVENKPVEGKIILSPNPAKRFVNIYFTNAKHSATTIQLLDAEGKLIQQKITSDNQARFELVNIAQGVYFISIFSNNKLGETKKLIIEK